MSSKQIIREVPNFYELSGDLAHNDSSLMTAAGDSGVDGGPSITMQENSVLIGNSVTLDNLISRQVGVASVRHNSQGQYMTQASRDTNSFTMHRNSSTVEKPKGSLGAALNVQEM